MVLVPILKMMALGTAFALSSTFWLGAAGVETTFVRALAAGCGTTITYTLDKVIVNEEDRHGSGYDGGAFARHKPYAYGLCFAAATVFGVCGLFHPDLFVSSAMTTALAVFYVSPLPGMGGKRIKNLFPLAKMFFASAVWVGWGLLAHRAYPSTPLQKQTALMQLCVMFCKVSFFDIKDIVGDRKAGIVTFATLFGERATLMCVRATYALVGVAGLFAFPDVRNGLALCLWKWIAQHALGRMPRHNVVNGALAMNLQIIDLTAPWVLWRLLCAL